METEKVLGLVALGWLVGAFLLMARSVRQGQALADELAARHAETYEALGRPRPGFLQSVRRDRFSHFMARREYEDLCDPPLAARFEAHRRAEARILLFLLVSVVALFLLILAVTGGTVGGIEIRGELASDHARVFEIVESAFGSDLQARLVEVLRETADPQLSLVAALDGEIVGHIFFSPVTFEPAASPAAAQLSPVAVAPSRQGRGVGSALIRAGLEKCPSRGWSAVFLVGNPRFYERFGFRMAKTYGLSCAGPHGPFLQGVELRPGALSGVERAVVFHPAFAEIEGE